VDVAKIPGGYVLFFEGHNGIGAATSRDGINWKDCGLVTGLSGSDLDRYGRVTPHLVQVGGTGQMFFGAASRKTWDGNIMAASELAALPRIEPKETK
jgi:hypothetical protein